MLEDRTPPSSPHTQKHQATTSTASSDGLTRVGSIMGTPLYMSPEQCRGEALDARSDIYNLGVIAYQMLAGETPFKGDMPTVMKLHIEAPPPPLREKRDDIPKKVAQVVMSALAKNPDDRPARAASLASALHAYAERPGGLLRRALTLASEHFPTFLRVSLILYAPVVLFTLVQSLVDWLTYFGVIPQRPGNIATACLAMLTAFVTMFNVTMLLGMSALLVTQLMTAPLRPIQLRPAFAALRKRLWPLITTTLRLQFKFILLLILGVIPGILFLINSSLTAPVVMLEGLKGKAALARSKVLTKRAKRMVIMILLIEIVIPTVVSGVLAFFVTTAVESFTPKPKTVAVSKPATTPSVNPTKGPTDNSQAAPAANQRKVKFSLKTPDLVGKLITLLMIPITFFFHLLSSILTSLLYLTTRQAGGETLKEALSQFEDEEMPRSKWQQRMRERQLSAVSAHTSSASSER
jgi:hypothetical protein